jgi:hypothetical protein
MMSLPPTNPVPKDFSIRLVEGCPDAIVYADAAGLSRGMAGRATRYGAGALLSVPAQHKDGKQLSIDFTILPLHDQDGALLGIAAFLRDATARFEEMRALRRELAALKPQPVGAG